MTTSVDTQATRPCWFVGAAFSGDDNQTLRFLNDGIWENGYEDKYLDLVKLIQVGDRIAIKSSYTRKLNLPFDNRSQTVSVMAIKAVGIVTENMDVSLQFFLSLLPHQPFGCLPILYVFVQPRWHRRPIFEDSFEVSTEICLSGWSVHLNTSSSRKVSLVA